MRQRAPGGGARRLYACVLLLALAGLSLLDAGPAAALAAAAAGGAWLLLCRALPAAVGAPRVSPARVRTALRDRERRTAFLPQRDPDAAGRPRPRAPGRRPATAV